ncbi:Uncharacterised protein [Dermatophilus congolensis]|uniref:Uncharacterized protein n=1 Tax=Dermatophilus congolensis TaxID=1863 RepID=A0AA46H0Q1_9MICO|nr:Uncharacterised protein [Dermatophilus congolensis]
MTTSAALPPSADTYLGGYPRRMGEGPSASDIDLARARVRNMQGVSVAEAIEKMPSVAARRDERRHAADRADRVPDSTRSGPDDERTAAARAAQARAAVNRATYEGVASVIDETGNSAAAQETENADAVAARSRNEESSNRRRALLNDQAQRAERAVLMERLDAIRTGLAASRALEVDAAVSDIDLANLAARTIAAANATARPGVDLTQETLDSMTTLTRTTGAISRIQPDGTVYVELDGHSVVERNRSSALALVPGEASEQPDAGEESPQPVPKIVWPSGRQAHIGGTVAGHLEAVSKTLPEVTRTITAIATVASAEAYLGDTAIPALPQELSDLDVSASTSIPRAADLLEHVAASVKQNAREMALQHEVATAVTAITAGPPASFYAAVMATASASGVTGPAQLIAEASQTGVSDLQALQSQVQAATDSAASLATAPFIPVHVASSDPALVRVNTPWPAEPVPEGSSGPTGPVAEGGISSTWPDLDILTTPLSLELNVIEVARGEVAISRMGVPASFDLSGGQPLTVGMTMPGGQGDATGAQNSGQVSATVPPPVTIENLAGVMNGLADAAGLPVETSARTVADGYVHLVVESAAGMPRVSLSAGAGPGSEALGGLDWFAPRTETLVMSNTPGLAWSAVSNTSTVQGPVPGLTMSLSRTAAGERVTLLLSPDLEAAADAMEHLVSKVDGVVQAGMYGTAGVAITPDVEVPQPVVGQAPVQEELAPMGEASVIDAVRMQARQAGKLAAAYGADPPVGFFSVVPVQPEAVGAAAVAVGTSAVPEAEVEAVLGRSTASSDSAAKSLSAFADNPKVSELVQAISAGLAAIPGVSVPPSGVVAFDEADIQGRDVVGVARRRVALDRAAFVQALEEDPAGTRAAVRTAAAEIAAAGRESLDGRVGLFAVRLAGETALARQAQAATASAHWDRDGREAGENRLSVALTGLLDRLTNESAWLQGFVD